ncbi:hypothetical protein [Azospirillum sp. B506]|uniref:hypothetical protein n=1 Tax=Azospirillum sp. B506 TaxID=137721 RepID=UPI0003478599|nr:hypothetical protein [Azospirillum sp. B506]
MRVLVYGMQSSGATAFTLFLAQRPDCLALVDVANNFAAPRIASPVDMVTKVVVTTAYPLAVHIERFRPDRVVLLLRDPRDNYVSLRTKNYRNHSGLMDEKFLILDQVFAERDRFDAVIRYEDFVARDPAVLETVRGLGWPVEEDFYTYRRRHDEMLEALWRHAPGLMAEFEFVFGNVQGTGVSDRFRDKPREEEVESRLEALCPRLLAHYRMGG